MLSQKYSDFPTIQEKQNNDRIPNWNKRICLKLKSASWMIDVNDKEMSIMDNRVTDKARDTPSYKSRTKHLSLCLAELQQNTDDLTSAVDALKSTINLHDGPALL